MTIYLPTNLCPWSSIISCRQHKHSLISGLSGENCFLQRIIRPGERLDCAAFACHNKQCVQEETGKSSCKENEYLSGILGQLPAHTLSSIFQTNCSVVSSANRLHPLPGLLAFNKMKLPAWACEVFFTITYWYISIY